MRRLLFTPITAVALLLLTVAPSIAASPHFTHGGDPVAYISGTQASKTVVVTGELAGLGNENLLINVSISGFTVYECQNNGGRLAPGQNKVLEGPLTVPTEIDSDAIKNGRVAFTTDPATLTAAETVSADDAGCPNGNWTGVNPTVTVTSVIADISQGGVLLFHCTASDPNGLFGTVALNC